MLHPCLEPALMQIPQDRPVILFTRHSLRELAPNNGIPSYDLPLTAEGVVLAEQWGGRLNRPIKAFYSSPVGRCVHTAQAMARGAGIQLPIIETSVLVEPGCFVHSIRHVGAFYKWGLLPLPIIILNTQWTGFCHPKRGRQN